MALLEPGRFKSCPTLGGPNVVRDYLRLKLMAEPNEVFVVVFLNSQHQVLACEPLFKGTVSEASVYPRVVVQRSEEHTSELQSLMRISYAVFCLKKKLNNNTRLHNKT